MRLAILALTAAASLSLLEGCFGCDAGGIDEKPVSMQTHKLEAQVTCGQAPSFHVRASDEKGNVLTFDLARAAHDGETVALSVRGTSPGASDQVVRSSDSKASMAVHMAAGADAIDATVITSAVVEIKSFSTGDEPFAIQVRIGFADGATLNQEYRGTATPDATCDEGAQ